jgi:hypothetical protein
MDLLRVFLIPADHEIDGTGRAGEVTLYRVASQQNIT